MELPELVEVMDQVAAALRYPMDVEETLEVITSGAVGALPGIDYVSLSVTGKDHRIETLAPTDPIATRADELQYELGEGPCLDAAFADPVVQVDDLRNDPRWPAYGPRAAKELGLRAQLAFQFRAEPHVRGGFNLYCRERGRITSETRQVGVLFANLAAVALGWSRQNETLTEAMESRNLIGQAIGIIMERYGLDADRAFAFLIRTSQTANVKLREVAAGVVADAATRAG